MTFPGTKKSRPRRFGVHAPMAGGLLKALDWVVEAGGNALQIFSGNPNAWKSPPWRDEQCSAFIERRLALDIRPCILHTPYLINLATPDDANWAKSGQQLRDALVAARRTGSEYVNSHIGSHLGAGTEYGIRRVADALLEVLGADGSDVSVLLENTNGSGNTVGSRLEELAEVLNLTEAQSRRLGVCIDTAHAWAAGYDLSTAEATTAFLDEFDALIGLDHLRCIHANDNRRALNGRSDVHEHIGKGLIGPEAFRALVNDERLAHVVFILETPKDTPADDRRNLRRLRGYQRRRGNGAR